MRGRTGTGEKIQDNIIPRNIDDLHKNVYSISEPRWADAQDSKKISDLRKRIKKLYAKYEKVSA